MNIYINVGGPDGLNPPSPLPRKSATTLVHYYSCTKQNLFLFYFYTVNFKLLFLSDTVRVIDVTVKTNNNI